MAASSPEPSKSPPPPTEDDDDISPSTTPNQSPPPTSSPPPKESSSPPPPVTASPHPPASSPPPPHASSPPPPDKSPPPPPDASSPPPPDDSAPPPPDASPPPPPDDSPPPPPDDSPPPPPPTTASPPPPPKTGSPPPTSSPPLPPTTGSPPPPATTGSPPPLHAVFSPPPPAAGRPSQRPPPPPKNSLRPAPSGNRPAGGSSPVNGSAPPSSNSDVAIIAGILVGGIALLALIIICLAYSRKKKKPQYYMDPGPNGGDPSQWQSPPVPHQVVNIPPPPGAPGKWAPPPTQVANMSTEFSSGYSGQQATPMASSIGTNMKQFVYEDLAMATSGFSEANLLGQGGFGYVHKGVLPSKGEVAVKSLKTGSGQGEREFQAEVEIISRVHHRHLVSLVGYCIANEQRLLVYEFVPNNTLEFHLHGKDRPVMDWSTRLKIAVGSAKGLAYLHEDCHPRIIHRDIKSANILLDNNFEAMVADFGLAKLTSDNYTHVSTRVMGTFGYLAPEYASSGKLTEKSDVFSFGVMLLELITGRRPVDPTNKTMEDSLVDWARPLLSKAIENGNCNELVDPLLEGNYVTHEMAGMVTCAAASIRHSARRRPKMSQIAHALEGDSSLDDLNEGVKPMQSKEFNPSPGAYTGGGEEAYNTMAYNDDMMKFRKMVMSSQDFNSSDYGTTSDPSSSSGDNSREMPKPPIESKRTYT